LPTFVHVGCGPKRQDRTTREFASPRWTELRFDIDPAVEPDLVGSMTDMAVLADASVDAVFSSHNIEHLYAHEVPRALREFARVLRDDGYAVLTCPDLQSICSLVADDRLTEPVAFAPAGPITPIDMLYGHRASLATGNLFMAHRCGFTKSVLVRTLQSAGFPAVASLVRDRAPFFDLWAVASKAPRTEPQMLELAGLHFPGAPGPAR
jgi:SAM-dependent methyltransferase